MERKPTLKGKWVNAISEKQLDNLRKEIHVVSVTNSHLETDAIRDKKDRRLLLHKKRRHRLTGRYPPIVQVLEVKALLGREAELRAKILLEGNVRIRHVICGTLPCVSITSLNPDARMATNVGSDMLRLMCSPAKRSKKSCGKGSVASLNKGV